MRRNRLDARALGDEPTERIVLPAVLEQVVGHVPRIGAEVDAVVPGSEPPRLLGQRIDADAAISKWVSERRLAGGLERPGERHLQEGRMRGHTRLDGYHIGGDVLEPLKAVHAAEAEAERH